MGTCPVWMGLKLPDASKQEGRGLAGATIMMLTSDQQTGDAVQCREIRIKIYLVKPIGQSDLLDGILNALGSQICETSSPAIAEAIAMRPLRLLLVEDNAVNRELALRLLRKRGHEVVVATNGREALDLLDAGGFGGFDAVLMDVQMPEMDGMEATAAIRAQERTLGTHLPIIGVTARTMKGDRGTLRRWKYGWIQVNKPIRPETLFSELARLVSDSALPKREVYGSQCQKPPCPRAYWIAAAASGASMRIWSCLAISSVFSRMIRFANLAPFAMRLIRTKRRS